MTAATAAGGGRLGRAALVEGSTRGSLVAPRPQFSPLLVSSLVDPAVSLGSEALLLTVLASTLASLKTQLGLLAASSLVESRGECSPLLFEPILSSAAALQWLSSDLIRTGWRNLN